MCEDWYSFISFYNWAIKHGYSDDLQIDRIDNNGNYCPSNCRWVDIKTNMNNRRSNVFLTYDNQTHTIAEWSDIVGIKQGTIGRRIRAGWTIANTLTKDVGNYKKRGLPENLKGGDCNENSTVGRLPFRSELSRPHSPISV